MIYIDPSENRENSRLKNNLAEFQELPGLENRTGADMLIGAPNLPHPANDFLLKKHLDAGAALVQVKYGLDLIASIIDGRYKSSQAKMLATGANPQQVILLFIAGVTMEDNQDGSLIIGGKPVKHFIPQAAKFNWLALQKQIFLWTKRGGIFEHLQLEYKLNEWIGAFEETMQPSPEIEAWPVQQKIFLVEDWRNTLTSLPGIGPERANTIFDEYGTWPAFYDALVTGALAELPGVGKKTITNIKAYLGESE